MATATVELPAQPGGRPLSVSEFTMRVKATLEGTLAPCWVRGEVSGVRPASAGHLYFSLKDAGAVLPAVLFHGQAVRQKVTLRDGQQVVVRGEINVYPPHGKYTFKVYEVVDDGVGALQRRFEELKKRLSEEGLFDQARKKPVPEMPSCVGFVTSPTGAAVQDFIRILERRGWKGRVVVLPAKVQGEGAAAEVAAMLALAEALGIFDLLVVGRGGGSIEDLWAFNEEALVRAVAACRIPTVSAVGHQTDFTLCDFAADCRAETPSAAAELISSAFVQMTKRVELAGRAASAAVADAVLRARERVAHDRSRLRLLSPTALVERGYLKLGDLSNQLWAVLNSAVREHRRALLAAATRLDRVSPSVRVEISRHRLDALGKRLAGASPRSVLHRGFAILRDEAGQPVTRRQGVKAGQRLEAEFADGRAPLRAERD